MFSKAVAICFLLCSPLFAGASEPYPSVAGEYVVHWDEASAGLKSLSKENTIRSWMSELGQDAFLSAEALVDSSYWVVRLAPHLDAKDFLKRANAEPGVASVEPNYLFEANETAEDPMSSQLWGMTRAGGSEHGLAMDAIWASGRVGDQELRVGIVDSGIDWTHPDLSPNLFTNPGESGDKARNGVDDDGNGYIDDVHGWNFAAGNSDSRDDLGHGTHVAGTIGAVGSNGIGVAGVNWKVSLVPLKFLAKRGQGSLSAAVGAIDYAIKMNCRVLNNSWGGGPKTKALEAKIQEAGMKGILFVASAGNDHRNNDGRFMPAYPASYDGENILSVAAIDRKGDLAKFSNYGKTKVDVAAPGVDILSTFMGGGYKVLSGTSMAAPHVTGLAALMIAAHPWATPQEVIRRLIQTSVKRTSLSEKSISGGRIDAEAALNGF